ncbi:MAG: hypothetical protein M1826_000485 [Phylliscum demangeonii]|nr:MAG: hypothetical protein M1826_000485 [Phylliscum demangeonii]
MSPARPPSARRRQSLQLLDLENRLDQLVSDNRQLHTAKSSAERSLEQALEGQRRHGSELSARDVHLREKISEVNRLKGSLELLQDDLARLTSINESLTATNIAMASTHEARYAILETELADKERDWEQTARELDDLRQRHEQLEGNMESIVREEVTEALSGKNAEIDQLRDELESTREQVQALQKQILENKPKTDFLTVRDEDYFENACQELCQHAQQWVLRFSKFSDMRGCRLVDEVPDEKIVDRLENAILDGSDVDIYLNDRVKRRDVFMSIVMTMVWEFIFTRYLFGMDREQRQKLKSLERSLSEVGPPAAVHQWRATTLTLLSKRPGFQPQREQDTEAVVHEVFHTLAALLPPPGHLEEQIKDSLRNMVRSAVEVSIEMRVQRAEYMMLPPLQPEYDTQGNLAQQVYFNAALMNNRSASASASGRHERRPPSNEELEDRRAVVRMVLFPLVVKKGDDDGSGEDEIVVCPAQVLVTDGDGGGGGGGGRGGRDRAGQSTSLVGLGSPGASEMPARSVAGTGEAAMSVAYDDQGYGQSSSMLDAASRMV